MAAQQPDPLEQSSHVDRALEAIAMGASLRDAAKSIGLPLTTMFRLVSKPEFSEQYAHARESQADVHFDRIAALADDVLAGKYGYNEGRVAIDALKWAASKLRPKVYGDRIEVSGKQDVHVTVSLGTPPALALPNIEAPRTIEAQVVQRKGTPKPKQRRKRTRGPNGG